MSVRRSGINAVTSVTNLRQWPEERQGKKGLTVWFTGLSGSGERRRWEAVLHGVVH